LIGLILLLPEIWAEYSCSIRFSPSDACSSSEETSVRPDQNTVTSEEFNWAANFRNMMAETQTTKGISAEAESGHELKIICEFYKYAAGAWVSDGAYSDSACASLYREFSQVGNTFRNTARVAGFRTVVLVSSQKDRSVTF
jgi:hypothetical protein